jgi:hypothetical protein
MTYDVSPQDRVTLLGEGITVLSVDTDRHGTHVYVAGRDDERVRKRVGQLLGDEPDVWVAGELPRQLRPRACAGYLERDPGCLQLRYVVQGAQHVDHISVAEDDDTVVVFGTVCTSAMGEDGEPIDCPAYVELDRPLEGRTVIDGVSGRAVPYRNVYEGIEEAA